MKRRSIIKSRRIVGLGYCSQDCLCRVPRIPVDDKVQATELLEQGGGPAATAIVTAARLGAACTFIGVVGDDARGQAILEGLAREGVDTRHSRVRLGSTSPVAYCWVDEASGGRSIVWSHGSGKPLLAEEIDGGVIQEAGLLHLDGHQTQAAVAAAKLARAAGTCVSLDAGTVVPGIEDLLELADIVIASKRFSEHFTGERDPEAAARRLFYANRRFAAVTLGSAGCLGWDGQSLYRQPALPVDVVDTTGAGDVFHGAFAYRCVRGGGWADCLRFASAVSALKCTKLGGRTGIPTLDDAEAFLRKQGD